MLEVGAKRGVFHAKGWGKRGVVHARGRGKKGHVSC